MTSPKDNLVNSLLPEKSAAPIHNSSPPTPHLPTIPEEQLLADTGTTANFVSILYPVINKRIATNPIAIRNPNGSIMHSTHIAELDLPTLPLAARQCHIVPALANHSLLSVGQLCDAGCSIELDATTLTVTHKNTVVLTGTRTAQTRLWQVDRETPTVDRETPTAKVVPHFTNAAIGSATPAETVAFAHAALFSPALSTLHAALEKGYLHNFPGLTARSLRKYPPRSAPMVKGHLDQARQNTQSTKPKAKGKTSSNKLPTEPFDTAAYDDHFPTQQGSTMERTHHCYLADMEPTGQIYTDQTGKFVAPSSQGNNYQLICYDFDSNAILAVPFKNRTAACIKTAFEEVHQRLNKAGLRPAYHRLDNECSDVLKKYLTEQTIEYQLVVPGSHRRNAAERAIRTWKNHFIAGLCSVDKDFPLHLWDRLLPQAELTLNLMRGSRLNPKLSAWAQLHGTFDFNKTPIAPPGIRVLVHEQSDTRTTWSPHASDGWYIGPALESYRCFKVWIWETRAVRICDTLSWFPTKVTMPLASSNDLILAGIKDILAALANPSANSPLAPLTDSHTEALRTITTLLTNLATKPPTLNPTTTPEPTMPTTKPIPTTTAPALRVEPPTQKPAPAATSIPIAIPEPTTTAPVLRVELAPVPPKTVHFDPEPPATFANSTGPAGKRRRRNARRKTTTPSKPKFNPRKPKSPTPTKPVHHHGTRANRRRQMAAANAATATIETAFANPLHHFALHGNAFNPDTGQIAEYPELRKCSEGPIWENAAVDEIGRLFQGLGPGSKLPDGTNTCFFISHDDVPDNVVPTYVRIVAAYRPEKDDPYRIRWTAGGNLVHYDGNTSTKTADLTTVKILANSVISTEDAKFLTIDLKDFYLGTPMKPKDYAYMRIPVSLIPAKIMEMYNLAPLVKNGHVCVRIEKGMYGLPQAGIIANERLTKFLQPHGYSPCAITPGLWQHDTRDIKFSLVVDDFGVKYTDKADVEHLQSVLAKEYILKTDWTGSKYCGLTLDWDYTLCTVDISMPGYIERALLRFSHKAPTTSQDSPHAWSKPNYGAKTQYAPLDDTTDELSTADKTRIQEIVGVLLFYGRAVDSTLLPALGTIATQQSAPTATTMHAIVQLLDYCASHPDATVRFTASDMILHSDSDASYLSAPKARSRAAGYHYLSSHPKDASKGPDPTDPAPPNNGAIHVMCNIMREVLASAAEAELAALFHNGREACPLRITLEELGHKQPPTPIATDNTTASGIANDTVKQKRSKAIDMRFYWIRDRTRQGQFVIYWRKGILNKADYFTKHHSHAHHREIRSSYLLSKNNPANRNYFECLEDDEADSMSDPDAPHLSKSTPASGEGVLNSRIPDAREPGNPFTANTTRSLSPIT